MEGWRERPKLLLLISVFILSFLQIIHGKIVEGHLKTTEKWSFLSRFCFLSERGRLEFEFQYPTTYAPQSVLLYYDTADQWVAVYKTEKTCYQKEAVLNIENNQKLMLTDNRNGCERKNVSGATGEQLVCKAGRFFRSARERWWFIAISNCGSTKGLDIKYKMELTNGDNIFFKHFSADEFYILQEDIGFLFVFLILLILSIVVAVILSSRQLFHTTYKMYMTSLALQIIHLFLMCVTYGKYANDGIENRGLLNFARIFDSASILTFILMLILMGKGYTITRGRLSQGGAIKIAIFMTLYSITYAVLFIYEAVFFDPGQVLYLYESPPGYGLIALRLLAWVWFCYAIFFTLKHYPEKSMFYYPFFIFYTIWFWIGPILIIIAMFVFQPWVREKTINGVNISVMFIGDLIFLILTRPGAANKNFPYHVRTSQIGVMNTAGQTGVPMTASKQTDSFAPHPYAPTAPPPNYTMDATGPDFNDLFCVQKEKQQQQQQNGHIDNFPHQYPNTQSNPFIVTQTR